MSLTVNKYRRSSRERVATFRDTSSLTAEELAVALILDQGRPDHDDDLADFDLVVTERAARKAVHGLIGRALDHGFNDLGDNAPPGWLEAATERVVERLFDGDQYVDMTDH